MNKKYIIIGASAAAIGAINGIRRVDQNGEIICISAEKEMPYNKCFLADYLAGKKELGQLAIFDQAQQDAKRVHLLLGTRITKIDSINKIIFSADGQTFTYDVLLIATGSTAQLPEIARNTSLQGIFTFHTAADAQAIISYCDEYAAKKAVVVGTGLTGLECADALLQRGISVEIVQRGAQLMSNQLDTESAELLANHGVKTGVQFHPNEQVVKIDQLNGKVNGLILKDGKRVVADLVIFATGFKPNSQLAQDAGLLLEQGAIVTSDAMQTSDPHIYAAGDVALVKDQISGQKMISCLWPDAMLQGLIAGQNMATARRSLPSLEDPDKRRGAGQLKLYPGMVPIMSSAFFGVKVACYQSKATPIACDLITHNSESDFYKIYIQNKRVCSFYLVGTISLLGSLKRALLTNTSFILE